MENLPNEVLCYILSCLDINSQLICRLVCHNWNKSIEINFTSVTHIKLNQSAIDDSFIPEILFPDLKVLRITCSCKKLTDLFTFIGSKFTNVKVLSANTEVIKIKNLTKIATNLLFFQVFSVPQPHSLPLDDLFSKFNSLNSFYIKCMYYFGFCHCKFNSSKLISYSNACYCRLPVDFKDYFRSPLTTHELPNNLTTLKWLDISITDSFSLNLLPNVPCLQLLSLKYSVTKEYSILNFNLPHLKYFNFELETSHHSNQICQLINSLEKSKLLQVICVQSTNDKLQLDSFIHFAASLDHLISFKFVSQYKSSEKLSIPLGKKLTNLWIESRQPIQFTQAKHSKLKYLKIFSSNNELEFDFPSLIEFMVKFHHPSNPQMEIILNSLRKSPHLTVLKIDISLLLNIVLDQVNHIASFIVSSTQLTNISVSIGILVNWNTKCQRKIILSNHTNLKVFRWHSTLYHPYQFVLDKMPYDQINYNSIGEFTLSRICSTGKFCTFDINNGIIYKKNNSQVTFSSKFNYSIKSAIYRCDRELLINDFPNLTELKIKLTEDSDEVIKNLVKIVNKLSFIEIFSLESELKFTSRVNHKDIQLLLGTLSKKNTLKLLYLTAGVRNQTTETVKVILDTSKMSSLTKLNVKWLGSEVNLMLLVISSHIMRQNNFDGIFLQIELMNGHLFEASIPKNSQVISTEQLTSTKSLAGCIKNLFKCY